MSAVDSLGLARLAVAAAADKKAEDIVLLDLRLLSSVTDYFIIATGGVGKQLDAIGENIKDVLKRNDRALHSKVHGSSDSGWVLMDFGDMVIHLFTPGRRTFYDLEGLWSKAPVLLRMQ